MEGWPLISWVSRCLPLGYQWIGRRVWHKKYDLFFSGTAAHWNDTFTSMMFGIMILFWTIISIFYFFSIYTFAYLMDEQGWLQSRRLLMESRIHTSREKIWTEGLGGKYENQLPRFFHLFLSHYITPAFFLYVLTVLELPLLIWQLKNGRGHILKCSHYVPSPFPENTPLPCVIYCHGNRLVSFSFENVVRYLAAVKFSNHYFLFHPLYVLTLNLNCHYVILSFM